MPPPPKPIRPRPRGRFGSVSSAPISGPAAPPAQPEELKAGEALPVRSAPFEYAGETGSVASAAHFFICTRSHDQKWFGIVFDESGTLAERCGVSEPVTRRRDYDGPCRSGWVQSAFVKVIAGEEPTTAPPAEGNNVSEASNSMLPGA